MPLGQGYPALANEKERGQFATLDARISEIDRRLSEINAGIGGNFKSLSTVFSSKEKPVTTNDARDNRFALVERAKAERQQLEQQRASLMRQRQGMEAGVQQRRLGTANAIASKLPPADQQLLAEMRAHPEKVPQFIQEAQTQIQQGIESGAGAEAVIGAAVRLRSVAALADNLNAKGTYSDSAKSGDFKLGPTEQAAQNYIREFVPRYLRESGVVSLPTPTAPQAPNFNLMTTQAKQQAADANPTLAGQIQDATRRAAPMPESIDAQPGTTLADKLNFASQGNEPNPGAGRQFVFTGGPDGITAGTAPAGTANPFPGNPNNGYVGDPAMAQRIMQRDISYKPVFNPEPVAPPPGPTPATPNQAQPLTPPGPVTEKQVQPPPAQLGVVEAARQQGLFEGRQANPFPPVGPPLPPRPTAITPTGPAGASQSPTSMVTTPRPMSTPAPTQPQAQQSPSPQPTQQEQFVNRAREAEVMASRLRANNVAPDQIRAALEQNFPDLVGVQVQYPPMAGIGR